MVDQNILVEMEWNQNCTILTFNKFPGQLDLTSTHAPQAVDDGVLQPLLGDVKTSKMKTTLKMKTT